MPRDSRQRSSENATRIAAEISRLLGHYWAAHEDPRLRAALAGDWLEDLREFDWATVAEACRRWRRGHGQLGDDGIARPRRPTIADIRSLCAETEPPRPAQARNYVTSTPTEMAEWDAFQERRFREAAEWRQRFAQERGFANFSEVIDYGINRAARIPAGGSPRSAATDDRPKPIYVDVPPEELLARFGGYATEVG